MAKRDEQTEKVRASILAGARAIFVTHGFRGASISQIARAASVSQGLIYHYFQDKVHLWKEVKKDALARAQVDPTFGAANAQTFKDFLTRAVNERFRFYREHPDIHILVGWEKLQSEDRSLLGVEDGFEVLWHKELTYLQSTGALKSNVDLNLLSAAILASVAGVFDYVPIFVSEENCTAKQHEYLALIIEMLHKNFGRE